MKARLLPLVVLASLLLHAQHLRGPSGRNPSVFTPTAHPTTIQTSLNFSGPLHPHIPTL